jgi:crotonobetainyl-CoA:carnitine CoA-transferase CaiB-like acyl-CoA transferase
MGALDGLKVVEAGLLVQGPQAAATLHDWGAEVVKVELPGFGDQARWIITPEGDGSAPFFIGSNRGKRSITVDLRVPKGRDIFLRLCDWADVVITNFKPGTMDAWGLGYGDVAARNPAVVYAAGSTFGPLGANAEREGADLAGQAAGGLIAMTGTTGGEPSPVGAAIADHIAAQNLVGGILAALIARGRTGRGQLVETSLVGGQIWAQVSEFTSFLSSGQVPPPSNHGHSLISGLYSIYPTADGWIAIVGVVGPARPKFYEVMGRPDLEQQFPALLYTLEDKRSIYAELAPVFSTRPTAEWCAVLSEAGIRHAPVRDYAAVAADPSIWENGYLLRGTDHGLESDVVGTPVRFSDTPAVASGTAPELGQHTEEVLIELGYTWEDVAVFRDAGAI